MSRSRDTKSTHWFVRITYPHIEVQSKLSLIEMSCQNLFIVSHVGERTEKEHIHLAIVLHQEATKQTLDNRLKKIFPVKGSDYSSKYWDGKEEVMSYMFHDVNHKIIYNKGYTEGDIVRFKELHRKVNIVVEHNKQRAPGRRIDGVVEHFKGVIPTKREIAFRFLEMIKNGEMYEPGDYRLKTMIEEVYLKLHTTKEDFEIYCASRINNLYQ